MSTRLQPSHLTTIRPKRFGFYSYISYRYVEGGPVVVARGWGRSLEKILARIERAQAPS